MRHTNVYHDGTTREKYQQFTAVANAVGTSHPPRWGEAHSPAACSRAARGGAADAGPEGPEGPGEKDGSGVAVAVAAVAAAVAAVAAVVVVAAAAVTVGAAAAREGGPLAWPAE